jgi:PTS system nitrogen regulatory IIA component
MKLTALFNPDQLLVQTAAEDKWDVIRQMVDAIMKNPAIRDIPTELTSVFTDAVFSREREIPTGVGQGVGFPHARIKGLNQIFIALAIMRHDLEWESPDNQPVRFVCLVIVPEEKPTVALKVISSLTTLLSDEKIRAFFEKEQNAETLYAFLHDQGIDVDVPVTAFDLMRPLTLRVYEDTPLREITGLMYAHDVEAVSVLDQQHHVVGEISCDHLFNRGLPDYIKELSTVPSIEKFDPFQKYFLDDAKAVARDVMNTDFKTLDEHASLLEIVFYLSVKKYQILHICRDKAKIGTIDRITVLNRVLNL